MPDYTPPTPSSITGGDTTVAITDSGTGHVAITVDGNEVARFEASGNVKVEHATAQIQTIDTTNNYAVTMKGGGGPRIQFGDTDSAVDSFMDMGSYGGINNIDTQSRDFRIHGTSVDPHLYIDENLGRIGIGTSTPAATLDVIGDARFRASVEVCTSDPAPANTETGTIYQFTKGSAGVFTLPASPPVGTQFVLVNGDGQDIVITRPHSSVKINGATSNATNTTAYAATSIVAVVSSGNNSEWLAFGGI